MSAVPAGPPPFSYAGIYRTDEDAYDALAQTQNALGFPLSKKRSKANPKTGLKNRVDVRCHRSGTYRPWKHNSNQYQTSSRKTNCPFHIIIRFDKNTGGFLFEVVSEAHNHDPVENPLDSCRSRRQSQMHFGIDRLEKMVENRSKIPGLTAKDIAEQISTEFPNVTISRHDVLCMQNKLRRSRTGAFATIQDFLDNLKNNDRIFYYAVERGPDDKLCRIFWIYRHNIEDWRRSPEVLMFDNTYKINRLKMPLLQITGTTPLHTNFSAGFGLTAKEDAAAFTWMLKQLKIAATKGRVPLPMVVITDFDDAALKKAASDIFDTSEQQVCMWHILKNVTLNIRKMWNGSPEGSEIMGYAPANPAPSGTAGAVPYSRHGEDLIGTPLELEIDAAAERTIHLSWQALQAPPPPDNPPGGPRRKFRDSPEGIRDAFVEVCRADSESEFWQRWAQLCYEFPTQKDIITYLHDTYVPERLQFAHFSVKWFQNYGIRMISRTKSSHLKDFFENTSTDLCQLEQHVWEMVMAYRESYELRLQNELGRQQAHWDEYSVVKDVALTVGSKTMDEILQQVRRALDELQGKIPSQPCSGRFTKQMGLPCHHHILSLMKKSESLELSHIDRHWWLKAFDQEEESTEQQEPELIIAQPANQLTDPPTALASAPSIPLPIAHLPAIPPPATSRVEASAGKRNGVRTDGRVPVPSRPRTNEQQQQQQGRVGRRNLKNRLRSDEQSGQQQAQVDGTIQNQPGAGEQMVQEQSQVGQQNPAAVNQQTSQNQEQVGGSSDNRQRAGTSAVSSTETGHSRVPVRSAVANTKGQTAQPSNIMQLSLPQHGQRPTEQQPPPPPPAPSYQHQQASLTAQVAGNPLVQGSAAQTNYQQFGGLANLHLYNLNGGVPQQPAQGSYGGQGLQYNFRLWQPPRQG